YPALDPLAPATISRPLITDLLRRELRFRGLCITDSLDMSGIEVDTPEHVIGRSIDAGIDAVMVTSHIDRRLAAAGWIERAASPDRVREALDRVSSFRERFATGVPDDDIDDEPARAALLTYGDVPASLDALAAVIAGERRPTGQLPVRLP